MQYALILLLSLCAEPVLNGAPGLSVANNPQTLAVGDTLLLTFQLVHSNGNIIQWSQHNYASSAPTVVSVTKLSSGGARAVALKAGTARITVTARSNTAYVDIIVTAPPPPPDTIQPPPPDTVKPPPDTTTVGRVFQVPASIDRTGGTDVTAALTSFFASVPDSSTISFSADAVYRIEGTLVIRNRRNLLFRGNGVKFVSDISRPTGTSSDRNRYHWRIETSTGITLRDINIRGANANGGTGTEAYVVDLEAQHGVDLSGARDVLLENLEISYVHGDFVYVGGPGGSPSKNVTIRGGKWYNNGRQGMAITNADSVLVENINMSQVRMVSIDIEPGSDAYNVRHVTIQDSYFGAGRLLWLARTGRGTEVGNIQLLRNRLDRVASVWVEPTGDRRTHNIRLMENVSTMAGGSANQLGIWNFWRVDGVTAHGNVQPVQPWRNQPGVMTFESCSVDVSPGQFPGSAQPDVVIAPYDGCR